MARNRYWSAVCSHYQLDLVLFRCTNKLGITLAFSCRLLHVMSLKPTEKDTQMNRYFKKLWNKKQQNNHVMSLKWNQEYTKGVFLLEIYGARICNVEMGNEIIKQFFYFQVKWFGRIIRIKSVLTVYQTIKHKLSIIFVFETLCIPLYTIWGVTVVAVPINVYDPFKGHAQYIIWDARYTHMLHSL